NDGRFDPAVRFEARSDGLVVTEQSDPDSIVAFPEHCITPCPPAWTSTPLADYVDSAPSIAEGRVFVGTGLAFASDKGERDGARSGSHFYAFPEECGDPCSPLWETELAGPTYGYPAVADGVIYVGGGHTFYALDAGTGDVRWRYVGFPS